MAQTKPKAGQFYGVSNNGTDGEFLQTDGAGGMAWAATITDPTITSIDYPGTQTAADPAGGESVIINGTLFASGITCTVGGTSAVTAFNSATQITITTPAKAAGPYTVAVLNPDGGTASENNFIQYSGVPVWSTAAGTLGNVIEGAAASFQVTATEGSDTIEYAVTTGTLPTGLSLATATGAITGTAPTVSADTTTTFSITATDDENQTSASRSFSITVQNDAPSNHFNSVLYTGNGSSRSITGLNFKPDFVWFKNRSRAVHHALFDSVRGVEKLIRPNESNPEGTFSDSLTSFNNNGFSLGSDAEWWVNKSGDDYVSWNLKAGGPAVANTDGTINSQVSANNSLGFSIATYTGNSTNGATIGHGLDSAPEMIIVKSLNTIGGSSKAWTVYVEPLGNTKNLYLNGTQAASVYNFWGNTSPTSSVLSLSSDTNVNSSVGNYVAYSFTSKPGFSKVGSYTGNGSSSGPMVQTGFQPAFVMIKASSAAGSWNIVDNKRDTTNPATKRLFANLANAEGTGINVLDFYANGFQIKNNDAGFNSNGVTYIYLAFAADGSTATPSLANSFATELYTGNGGTQSITSLNFQPDFSWIKVRSTTNDHTLQNSISGTSKFLRSNTTNAEGSSIEMVTSYNSNGFSLGPNALANQSSATYVAWNWKAGGTPSINTDGTTGNNGNVTAAVTSIVSANQAAGFSIAEFIAPIADGGIGYGAPNYGHGLAGTPDLVIFKRVDSASSWLVFSNGNGLGPRKRLELNNSTNPANTACDIFNAGPTTVGIGGTCFNESPGSKWITYNFQSISGYSKVGSYTGTASTNSITTGFQPSFVMIKRTDSSGSWVVMDSARGMGSNASSLFPNLSAAESNGWNTAFTATGFTISSTEAWINASGGTYIYLAIKEN